MIWGYYFNRKLSIGARILYLVSFKINKLLTNSNSNLSKTNAYFILTYTKKIVIGPLNREIVAHTTI